MTNKTSKLINVEATRWGKFFPANGKFSFHFLLFIGLFILGEQRASAQLKLYPVQRKNPVQKITAHKNSTARTQAVTPLSLPFWDDFSFTPINDPTDTFSSYPLRSLWEKGENVWINNGLGINAPTLNVASFDGLDSVGLPYSDQILLNGSRDDLISQPIKMADVSPTGRDSVFLSFFYQWQGNGEPPDASDYLRVEFKNNSGTWESIVTIYPKTSFDRTVFYDTLIKVDGIRFFHDDFQFRFKNYGRKSGPFDTWNIDYVLLNGGRTINSNSYPDRAVASTISPLFGDYYAMPIQHFFESKPLEKVDFDIQNLKGFDVVALSVKYFTSASFKNYTNGILSTGSQNLDTANVNGSGVMFPYERARVEVPNAPNGNDVLLFNPDADSIEVTLKTNVISGDDGDSLRFDFLPLDFRVNDTLSTTYTLNDYYAYDDGTAEYAAGFTNPGITMAYAFDLATTEDDTLAGFEIYFPEFSLGANRIVNFFVYADNNGLPNDANPIITASNRTVERKGLNTFQRINFTPVKVSKRFYIAFESDVQVGLDISHDTADKIFTNITGSWLQDADVKGSLMIRPLFIEGIGGPINGLPEEKSIFNIYPNPNLGEFYVDGKVKVLYVLSLTGQSLPFSAHEDGEQQKISIPNISSGLYLLKVQKGNSILTGKIIVR